MERKTIIPKGYWDLLGWNMFYMSLGTLVVSYVLCFLSNGIVYNIIGLVCGGFSIIFVLVILFYMIFVYPKKNIIFDKNNTLTSYLVIKGRFKKCTVKCKEIVEVKKKTLKTKDLKNYDMINIELKFITKRGLKFSVSTDVYSLEQLREIVDEIQKRGGLKDYKIDF